jgi:alanine dehydrogenase
MDRANQRTLLLTRSDIAALLDMRECIDAVETAFRLHAGGEIGAPGILGMHVPGGGFHVKAAGMTRYFAAKTNANFPANPKAGLPTIQGAILLFDARNGGLLAVMDSAEVTALRTGATTGVATRHLARRSASVLTLVGCGAQAAPQLRAVAAVRDLRKVLVSDLDPARAQRFAAAHGAEATADLPTALAESDICVTCTTSTRAIVDAAWVPAGCFIAAVGADNERKQEIDPALFRSARVVVDSLEQCAVIGDLHHALDAGTIGRDGVHAELGEIAAGHQPGRENDAQTILFDSCGVALGDVAAAALVYERALEQRRGSSMRLTD